MNSTRARPADWPPRGFLLFECAAALAVLGVTMMIALNLLSWTASARRAADRRAWALHEAQNLLERLTLIPYDRLTPESVPLTSLAARAAAALPGGSLDLRILETDGPPRSKRLTVTIRWRDPAGTMAPAIRLTTWVYPAPRGAGATR